MKILRPFLLKEKPTSPYAGLVPVHTVKMIMNIILSYLFSEVNVFNSTVQSLTYASVRPRLTDLLVWTSRAQYIKDHLRLNVCHSRFILWFPFEQDNVSEKSRVIYLFRRLRQSRKCPFTHTQSPWRIRWRSTVCHNLTLQRVLGRP